MARTGYIASNGAVTFDPNGFYFQKQVRVRRTSIQGGDILGAYNWQCGGWSTYCGSSPLGNGEYKKSGDYWSTGGVDASGSVNDRGSVIGSITSDIFYTLTDSSDSGGKINGLGEYRNGTNVSLTAVPDAGYIVDTFNGVLYSDNKIESKKISLTVSSDMGVVATFKRYYTLAFDANGGASSGMPSKIEPCFPNTDYKLPSSQPSRTGYKFEGWGTDASALSAAYQPGDNFNLSSIPGTSAYTQTLYAVWSQYKLTYDSNGGDSTPSAQSYIGEVTLAPAISKSGYVFAGWEIEGKIYEAGKTYDLQSNVTAKAVWVGSKGIETAFRIPDGAPAQAPEVKVAFDGDILGGTEGKTVVATAQAEGLNAIKFSAWDIEGLTVDDPTANPLSFTMPDNDVRLTAVYELRPLTVNHGIDEASKVATNGNTSLTDADGSAVDSFVYGTEIVLHAPDPTEGYYFSGWYNGNERVSQNRNYTVVLTGDISLLARYSTEITVSKNEDGGTGYISVDGVSYENTENVSIRKELGASMQIAAVATSGAFGGWCDGEAILELFRDDTVVIRGKSTYVARFIAEAVTVQVTCRSVKNSDTDDGALGTLALAAPGVTDNGNGSYSVEGFTEVVLTATQADGGLPLFRVVEDMAGAESAIDISKPIRIFSSDRIFIARWGSKGKFQVSVSSADNAAGIAYIGESAAVTSLTGEQDSTVAITALPSNGYRFVGWHEGDRLVSEKARYSFALVRAISLQARFAEDVAAICVWEGSGENKRLSWKSKVFVMPRPFDPVAARVDAVGYPVSLSVGTYSSPDAETTRDHAVQVQNQSGRRLPRMRAERFLRISVESAHEVDSVVVATNLVEVN